MDYTRKLLLIRKILGLSQAALGKRIDLTGPHVYRLENGKSPITNVILDKYVEAFGVDPEWLMSENIEDISAYAVALARFDRTSLCMRSA